MPPSTIRWHTLSSKELLAALDVDEQTGLSSENISARRAKYGANILSKKRKNPHLSFFFFNSTNRLFIFFCLRV